MVAVLAVMGMDVPPKVGYFFAMPSEPIPNWNLYGENTAFPDFLHVERVVDRAAGLDWTIEAHRHLHLHQVFLLVSGEIRLTLDGEPVEIAPPVVVNLPRGTVHGFSFSAGTEGFVVSLPADDFPDLFAAPAETAALLGRAFVVPSDPDLERRFQALAVAHAGQGGFRRTLVRAEVAALLASVLERAQGVAGNRVVADPRMQRFEGLVRADLAGRQSLPDYARALGLSSRSLGRLCRRETGMTASDFVEALRMKEACRLLVYTRMSVQQVAYQLGFDDPSYFSRVFQRTLHLPPSQYRARFE